MSDQSATFENFGSTFQEKTVQALLTDFMFAEQSQDVLLPKQFELKHLQIIVEKFFEHKRQFKTYPSVELLEIMIDQDDAIDVTARHQAKDFLGSIHSNPLNGDMAYIQATSLDFCKRQVLKEAMIKAIEQMEDQNYDAIQGTIREALAKGGNRDLGHEYADGFQARRQHNVRRPLKTGWDILDKCFNGGWERGTLSTFIAPTGAGKSMFLVNCGAAGIAQGLNVVYITCEMADFKIGIRFDSYFSGVEINNVSEQAAIVEAAARDQAKGRLFIKEFPTKTATVQTIRSYLQRLGVTKDFKPDIVIVDYADLLRGSRGHGDKRFELEGTYEELRALAQELDVALITADQTNRAGLDMEIVTIGQIGESYAKATVCDVIMTISRRAEDKTFNSGRLFVAKSRLGSDGVVYPFILNSATVKVTLLEQGVDPIALYMQNNQNLREKAADRFASLMNRPGRAAAQ